MTRHDASLRRGKAPEGPCWSVQLLAQVCLRLTPVGQKLISSVWLAVWCSGGPVSGWQASLAQTPLAGAWPKSDGVPKRLI